MTWRYKKTNHFERAEFFQEWETELLGLEALEKKGVITGEDPF